jgi:S1-C subfamily serine protease
MKSTFLSGLLGVAVGAAIVGGAVWVVDGNDGDGNSSPTDVTRQDNNRDVSDTGSSPGGNGAGAAATQADYTALFEQVRPSIVRITTGQIEESPFDFGQSGLGSGVVIDTDGHIITNYHVVRGYDEVTVTFEDGTTATAEVVGQDPGNDIAVIQVAVDDTSVLVPAKLGDSSTIDVGSIVAAIGNPFGLDGSFTTGVISGLNRTLPSSADGRPIRGLLQTDTAVNPGNSGGALINLRGEVVGINTAIENPNGAGFSGVAYAVPINTPKRFLTQLVAGETIDHPRLGISGRSITPGQAKDLRIEYGVAVLSVENGSAADRAGLRSSSAGEGDIILEIDGVPMTAFEDLADYIDSKDVGDEVTLLVRRNGEDIELQATLQSWDSSA